MSWIYILYKNIDLAKKDVSDKLIIFGSNRKNGGIPSVGGRRSGQTGVMTQGRREIKVGTLFLSNDENNVIAENVLSFL